MKKRLFAMLLTVVMVFGCFGVQVFAADWREEPAPFNSANQYTRAITVNSKLYAIFNNGNIEIFDPSTSSWSQGASAPAPIQGIMSNYAVYGKDIYVLSNKTLLIYDTLTDSWSQSGSYDFISSGHTSMTIVGNKMYVIGGNTVGSVVLDTLYIIDLTSGEWTEGSNMPTTRYGSCPIAVGNKIYVFGGTERFNPPYNGVATEIYNIDTDSWSIGTDMLHNTSIFNGTRIGSKIYVLSNGGGSASYVSEYDPPNDQWTIIAELPEVMVGSGIAELNNRIYVIGYGASSSTMRMMSIGIDGSTSTSALSVLLEESETVRMSVTDNFADNTQYTWASSDPSVASVLNGTVTALSPGLTYITAESADGTFRESIPVRVVGQGEAAEERLAVYLNPSEIKNLYLNDDLAAITWSSMDTAVASVDTAGKVTGVGTGLTIVQARYQDETHQVYVRVS